MALSAACKVYIAFADGPLVASPTWTEVTAYVRSVRTSRGRSNELEEFGAGTATIVLDNRTRRFDPDYSSGPYFGNLLPRKQVKVECVFSGNTYPVLRGVIQSWQQAYPAVGRDATTTIQCADMFALLATWYLPESAHEAYARTLTPTSLWKLDGDAMVDALGVNDGFYGGARTKVDPIGAAPGASRVTTALGAASDTKVGFAPIAVSSTACTVSALFRADPLSTQVDVVNFDTTSGDWYIQAYGSGTTAYVAIGANVISCTGQPILDGAVHHVAAVRSGTNVKLYIDGVEAATATNGSAGGTLTATGVTVGRGLANSANVADLSNVAVWASTALTADQVATLADAALTGWTKQRVEQRAGEVLDILGLPSALYSLQTSSSSVGTFVGDTDALSYLQRAARSDQGRLYASRSGVVAFEAKTDDMGASSAATFADDSTANAVRYQGFELELDDRLIYNEVVVAGVDDATFAARNSTSITTYSRRSIVRDTELPTSDACRDVAEALVSRYATPATRGRSWTVHPERTLVGSSTLAWATVMGRELGDIVTVKRSPSVGSAISKVVQITSIANDINLPAGSWTVTFTGAPAYTTAAFRWGTSNWGGTEYWS
jgi:hypothetical protein